MQKPLALLLTLFAACSGDTGPDPGERPSILLVSVDTLRYDALGCSGSAEARTPRIDRLASRGARCENVWTVCPLTLPAHASMLTGLLPPEHGLRDNDPALPLARRENREWRTLAESLRDRGYSTGAFISASVLAPRTGMDQGFDVYDGPSEGVPGALRYAERRGGDTAMRAAEWLRGAEEPFFCWVHLFDPHDPYEAPEPFRVPAPPDSVEAYAAEVSYADYCVGILDDALEDSGVAPNTILIVTSDHGEGLGEHGEPTHGYLLHETTLHVPLVVRWPGRVEPGSRWTGTMSLAKVSPWILSAADGNDEAFQRGPRQGTPIAESLYGFRHMGWAQLFAGREGAAKLIRGRDRVFYDLAADPTEGSPTAGRHSGIETAMNRYRALAPRFEPGDPAPDLPDGFPYAGGLGRSRLLVLPWPENEKLPGPDPLLAAAIDAAKARVGVADDREVDRELRSLLERDRGNPTLHFWIGRNAMKARLHGRAREGFSKAFELGLREPKVLNLWLKETLLDGDLEAARRIVEEKLPRIVPDAGSWVMAGAFHLECGDIENAKRCAARAEPLARTESERKLVAGLLSRFRHNSR